MTTEIPYADARTDRLAADGFPADAVRARARVGSAQLFPPVGAYGRAVFGADPVANSNDSLDRLRLVPPVFMPERLEKLIDLGREPMPGDVELGTTIGGFRSPVPVFCSALGSTDSGGELGVALSRQAGRLGLPMVIGENVVPVSGYGRDSDAPAQRSLLARITAYADNVPDGLGGVAVQQSTEDADAEVWNLAYSDPAAQRLLDSGRLAFELKVGQGAKPGLGGMTVLGTGQADALADRYSISDVLGDPSHRLRSASPGTFTDEILRQQIRLMRNNYPRARVWVKLHPGRDIAHAASVAWAAGADAVTVDGAEGGTGWAPLSSLDHVGLPLAECLYRIAQHHAWARPGGCLMATGRIWEGTRAVKALALGATAAGLGRAALLAVDEDRDEGLIRLVDCLTVELGLLISALGHYHPAALSPDDLWAPTDSWAATGLGATTDFIASAVPAQQLHIPTGTPRKATSA
ncbi:glutamate synthase-related protein [Kribbella sp. NBC_00382]|uniref:glutamate synthase-related protein n=1 Tax=Kribbella sp. NBC_00382 TaxID=2975967 RepID=UPI002E2027B8